MNKHILITAIILGLLSIILGAFAAHGLKDTLSTNNLNSFETGVKYQMYHALFLLFLANFNAITHKAKQRIYMLTLIGVIFFSFSIYLLSTQAITGINLRSIGFVTPIGGLLLIISWGILLIETIKTKRI